MEWSSPLRTLPGIGPKRAEQLADVGFHTIEDLLFYLPYRYLDASKITPIAELKAGETVTIHGVVDKCTVVRIRGGGRQFVTAKIHDETGKLGLTFFHQPYVAQQLKEGESFAFTGKTAEYKGKIALTNPRFESLSKEIMLHTSRIVPIYSEQEGLTGTWIRKMLYTALTMGLQDTVDYLPPDIVEEEKLMERKKAIWQTHFPDTMPEAEEGRKRLAFDEVWKLFLDLKQEAQERKKQKPVWSAPKESNFLEQFAGVVPFPLTTTQRQACENILASTSAGHPTSHVVQGEVGSGKTFVAAFALLLPTMNGKQSIYIAPTTILAEQHYATLAPLAHKLGKTVSLFAGKAKELSALEADVIISTHAVLHQADKLKPAVVVVDEEHRFGVKQREIFWNKKPTPHLITMTATPIPRTLAHVLFGEQGTSFLELIPGKEKHITTRCFAFERLENHFSWLKEQVGEGKQAFLLAPFIDQSTQDGFTHISDAQTLFAAAKKHFPRGKVGLLTGKTAPEEKRELLAKMHEGKLSVLVATPVIEVGIDIPQASIITITSAERFGLAQLHQLRGRVGRAGQDSWCFLVPSQDSAVSKRLKQLEEINNGAQLAEIDLQNRGVGEFLGTRQSGWDSLVIASWLDIKLLQQVQRVQKNILAKI
jgi:ATP-dependent DNA helicase RecG